MNDRQTPGHGKSTDVWVPPDMNEGFGRSILIVEDATGIRDMLASLLEMAGYTVTGCATAEEGLEALREDIFDFVLTDYALPNRSGGWLLQQARAEGLLDATTPAVVLTAHPDQADVEGFEVIRKPFDLDDLVGHVRRRLDDAGPPPRIPPGRETKPRRCGYGDGDDPEPIELVLYVTAASPQSARAIRDIERILSEYGSDRFKLTICDADASPDVNTAPTCPAVARRPAGPRTFILGHITNPDLLIELLRAREAES